MARSAVDLDEAVAAATEVFWRQGFEDASIEDVVQATGLNRYALYNSFGGKREIFLAALDAYNAQGRAIFFESFSDEEIPPLDAVRGVFTWAINNMADRKTGCLLSNVAIEVSRDDAVVAARIQLYLDEIETAYLSALTRAGMRGELSSSITPAEGAKLLITMMLGLGVRSRGGADREELFKAMNAGLAALGTERR